MIDFAALVLGPAMSVFGRPVTITPEESQPGAAPFAARGVYASKPVQIPIQDGTFQSTVQPTLGIRLADFTVPPMQGDLVAIPGLGNFDFVDVVPDGQGGADCPLRSIDSPVAATTIGNGG